MSKLEENIDWENEAPFLAGIEKKTPFRIPENYFDELPAKINNMVFLDGLNASNSNGFTVPENYFESLTAQIESEIALHNLKTNVKNGGFNVPGSYFETLSAEIINRITPSQPKKLRLWQTNVFKYASAACLVLFTASGIFYNNYYQKTQSVAKIELANDMMLYDIDESTIREHLRESQASTANMASEAEIETYILNHLSSTDITNNM
jgi:hypothetical protein